MGLHPAPGPRRMPAGTTSEGLRADLVPPTERAKATISLVPFRTVWRFHARLQALRKGVQNRV
jgi:hypothetical protein